MSSHLTSIKRTVTFKSSAFNTSEPKDYFINPGCFGDDLAAWLIRELQTTNFEVRSTPGQEDFGWYLNFRVSGILHFFLVGYRPASNTEQGTWIGWLERDVGPFASFFGGRKRAISSDAKRAIHEILSTSPQVSNVRWHYEHDFDFGREDLGTKDPES